MLMNGIPPVVRLCEGMPLKPKAVAESPLAVACANVAYVRAYPKRKKFTTEGVMVRVHVPPKLLFVLNCAPWLQLPQSAIPGKMLSRLMSCRR